MTRFGTLERAQEYVGKAYRLPERGGFAYVVKGWELGPTLDGEDVERTGLLVVAAAGDDFCFLVEPRELIELPEDGFCQSCGQIGCYGDGGD